MNGKNRSGVSAIDVVITIVILLALAALLLPAVQQTVNTTRRSQCKNNLRQIGQALHSYHDSHRTLPPGWVVSEQKAGSSGFGWGMQILPYIDQGPLFKQFNSRLPVSDSRSSNAALAGTSITRLRCPSDRGADPAESLWLPKVGTTNYVGNFGVGIPTTFSTNADSGVLIPDPTCVQGFFGPNSKIRFRDAVDGLSNVLLVGERRLPVPGADWPAHRTAGLFNSYWVGLPDVTIVSPLAIVATATGGSPEANGENEMLNIEGNLNAVNKDGWQQSLPFFGVSHGGDGRRCVAVEESAPVDAGFSSTHQNSCQVVLADGVARSISNNIDPIVFTNLMRRADGQAVGKF